MKKVFCFGEILLRMSPVLDQAWINNASMPVHIGGAELNVAKALAGWKQPVTYMSAMPDNYLSKEIAASIAACNIGVEAMQFCGDRIGVYFLPQGADLKNAGVIYDRAHASFSTALFPGKINWDQLYEGSDWFHFSAISPALNEQAAALCLDALQAAKRLGLTISVDLNYRAKLWKYGGDREAIMTELTSYCDVILGNEEDAEMHFGIKPEGAAVQTHGHDVKAEAFLSVCQQMMKKFPRAKKVITTLRGSISASHNTWAGVLYDGKQMLQTRQYQITDIVDRVGGGDSFMGGLIYGLLTYPDNDQNALDFAVAASCLKHTIKGDANLVTVDEVNKLMGGDASGRVAR